MIPLGRSPLPALLALALASCEGAPDADDLHTPRCGEPCDVLDLPDTHPCGATLDPDDPQWPQRLSDLGCFTSVDPLTPDPSLVPFDVTAPLHSDGSSKSRWISLPPGQPIQASPHGPWDFPVGALLLKRFGMALADGDRTLELRAMFRATDGWRYATWRLPPGSDDAHLLGDRSAFETLSVPEDDGRTTTVDWWYPNVEGCQTCHRPAAREVLGPDTPQLDRWVRYGEVWAPQLVALRDAGLLTGLDLDRDRWPPLADPYGDAPAADRARAWLHAQCAHCHQPGGFSFEGASLDLRHTTPLDQIGACDVPAFGVPPWADDGRLIAPGHPEASVLVDRLERPGEDRMPPGTHRADAAGIEAVKAWIEGLEGCTPPQ